MKFQKAGLVFYPNLKTSKCHDCTKNKRPCGEHGIQAAWSLDQCSFATQNVGATRFGYMHGGNERGTQSLVPVKESKGKMQ